MGEGARGNGGGVKGELRGKRKGELEGGDGVRGGGRKKERIT